MQPSQMKIAGIICLVISAVCIFYAVERYQTNADNVRAMNEFGNSSPLGGMMNQMTGSMELKPATPAETKYGALGAFIFGAGGIVLLVMGSKRPQTSGPASVGGDSH